MARAALSSPAGASPTGADEVFVPSNGVITFNLHQPPTEKKTEGLQYQEALFRTSCLKKAVFRVSCLVKTSNPVFRFQFFVFRENLGTRAGLRRAPGQRLCFAIRGPFALHLFTWRDPWAKDGYAETRCIYYPAFLTTRRSKHAKKGRDSCFVSRDS